MRSNRVQSRYLSIYHAFAVGPCGTPICGHCVPWQWDAQRLPAALLNLSRRTSLWPSHWQLPRRESEWEDTGKHH